MKSIIFAMVMAFAVTVGASFAGDAGNGQKLFEGAGKCKTCHKTDDKKLVGPGMAGVSKKYDDAFLHSWIKDPQGTWAAAGEQVEKMKAELKKTGKPKTAMAVPKTLSDGDVDDIIAYLKTL